MVRGRRATIASTAPTVKQDEAPAKFVEDFEVQHDLFEAITKPLSDMTDEEIVHAVEQLRRLRKVGMSRGKAKSKLDVILSALTPDKAMNLLKLLESKEEEKKEEKPKDAPADPAA